MTKKQVALLEDAVAWVQAEADKPLRDRQWDQSNWRLSAFDHASEILWEEDVMRPDLDDILRVADHCGTAFCLAGYVGQKLDPRYREYSTVDGVHVSEFARDALGISESDADMLFEASNKASMIRDFAEQIIHDNHPTGDIHDE